jgi:hypothetical protein
LTAAAICAAASFVAIRCVMRSPDVQSLGCAAWRAAHRARSASVFCRPALDKQHLDDRFSVDGVPQRPFAGQVPR